MRLNSKQINAAQKQLKRLSPYTPLINEAGYFEYYDINGESDFNRLKNILSSCKIVNRILSTNFKYNFNHFSFGKGYPEPDKVYTIKGILAEENLIEGFTEELDLEEKIELHDHLNPKIWDAENNLIQEVKDKIVQIVEAFKEQLAEDNVTLKIEDIYLLGSNANYNYNDQSDLDIHLIADESDDCLKQHLPVIYQAYKTLFNNKYNITIKGINVELYVENKEKLTNVSTGIYSLSKGWIKQPSRYDIPEIDDIELDKRVQFWETKYFDITTNPSIEKIENYIDAIYSIRQQSISDEGEFGIDNLVFKEIRRLGYLDELKDLKTNLRSKELSLE